MGIFYVDGAFVPAEDAKIPVDDLAVLRGFGVFDLMRTYGGKPFFLEAHLARLRHSAEQISLHFPWTQGQLAAVVQETLARNDYPEANIRIVVTGGSSTDFMTPEGKPYSPSQSVAASMPTCWPPAECPAMKMRSGSPLCSTA